MYLSELLTKWQKEKPTMLPYDSKEFEESLFPENRNKYSLAIKLLAFVGAFIGAIMFLIVLFILEVFKNEATVLFIGLACLVTSLLFSRNKHIEHVMFEPIILVLGILGQFLIPWGIMDILNLREPFWYPLFSITLIMGLVVLVVSKNIILRYFATPTIFLSVLGIIWESKQFDLVHLLIALMSILFVGMWIKEPKILSQYNFLADYFNPVSFGLLTAIILIFSITVNREFSSMYFTQWWVSSVILLGLFVYVIWDTLKLLGLEKWTLAICSIVILLLSPTISSPGIVASILILVLGFRVGHSYISMIGIISMIYFMIAFYYNLNTTLLLKSIYLMASGILFIGTFFILKKQLK
ncbi:MAG: DUF4401 domain-containing protein [Raineya sp.]|jgi:hypothetical protein|nr:DUF4401 domain-containing protein [Raineya sp.]